MKISNDNFELLRALSQFLNQDPAYVTKSAIETVTACGVDTEQAFALILASALGLDLDKAEHARFFDRYFTEMVHQLDVQEYKNNTFYRNIRIPHVKQGRCELKYESYTAYEAFVCDDFRINGNGDVIPQIGFFATAFPYPAILHDRRIWMTTIPNEINTMKDPINKAWGNVLTFGLGLGYYAYMVADKDEVLSITAVENNDEIIALFRQHLLPQFSHPEKVIIVCDDAFHYAEKVMPYKHYDLVFTDLWHDVRDGVPLYKKMKALQCEGPQFEYWIEKSMRCYM